MLNLLVSRQIIISDSDSAYFIIITLFQIQPKPRLRDTIIFLDKLLDINLLCDAKKTQCA